LIAPSAPLLLTESSLVMPSVWRSNGFVETVGAAVSTR